ncbi:Hsp70 family protein [Dactylosporangium sp. NPDC048998]|uniref:Hsp70 family protein n=1 Tax=Dactylosporangium sp. NPDC048998 TaxID=3363976 RepID=UPI00371B55CF
MVTLGVDFGTSSTVAVVGLNDGRVVPLLFGETPLLPSAVCVMPGGGLLVGRDAVQASRGRPEAFEPHPKARIDDGEVLLGERAVRVAELIGAVLRRVRDEALRVVGATVDRLVLTHPAGWGARRRQTLREAAAIAGLPPAVLVAEPVAAAAYYVYALNREVPVGRCLVVYDFGAGTFDASVVRRTAGGFEVLAEAGILDAGGLDVDAAIVAHLGATYGAGAPDGWRRLIAPAISADRRLSLTFWDDVRIGKEALSRNAMTTIFMPILELEAVLGREQLDHLARPLLERTVTATRLAIRNAGIRAEDIAAVFLVGGSSRMPLAATLLHQSLGVAPTVIEQPELVVASGTLHIDRAVALTAQPSPKDEESAAVSPAGSPPRPVAKPLAPAGPPDPSAPMSPLPMSPVSMPPVPTSPISMPPIPTSPVPTSTVSMPLVRRPPVSMPPAPYAPGSRSGDLARHQGSTQYQVFPPAQRPAPAAPYPALPAHNDHRPGVVRRAVNAMNTTTKVLLSVGGLITALTAVWAVASAVAVSGKQSSSTAQSPTTAAQSPSAAVRTRKPSPPPPHLDWSGAFTINACPTCAGGAADLDASPPVVDPTGRFEGSDIETSIGTLEIYTLWSRWTESTPPTAVQCLESIKSFKDGYPHVEVELHTNLGLCVETTNRGDNGFSLVFLRVNKFDDDSVTFDAIRWVS